MHITALLTDERISVRSFCVLNLIRCKRPPGPINFPAFKVSGGLNDMSSPINLFWFVTYQPTIISRPSCLLRTSGSIYLPPSARCIGRENGLVQKHLTPTNHKKRCQVCITNFDCYQMRYRLLKWIRRNTAISGSGGCKSTPASLPRSQKFDQHASHMSAQYEPASGKLTNVMKRISKELASQRAKSTRIRNDSSIASNCNALTFQVRRPSKAPLTTTDPLSWRKQICKDRQDIVTKSIRNPNSEDFTPFTFGCETGDDGRVAFGDGSDQWPFLLGVTMKTISGFYGSDVTSSFTLMRCSS